MNIKNYPADKSDNTQKQILLKKFMVVSELKKNINFQDTQAFAEEETQKFKELLHNDIIEHYYTKSDFPKFWCLLKATSFDKAEEIMHSLPFFREGFLDINIEELKENLYKK